MSNTISRRSFIRSSAIVAASSSVLPLAAADKSFLMPGEADYVPLNWLENTGSKADGVTWGTAWPKRSVKKHTAFKLEDSDGRSIAVQSWPLAFWPDGSLKWTGHAAKDLNTASGLKLVRGKTPTVEKPIRLTDSGLSWIIDTQNIRCVINKKGKILIGSVSRDGKEQLLNGRLELVCQDQPDSPDNFAITRTKYQGEVRSAEIEQNGPIRTVVKLEGTHVANSQTLLPFTLRLYFYANSDAIRILHTIIYDGDENRTFIKGLGIRFDIPMDAELHNRHVRFVAAQQGVFAEAVRGLTGLRRDPGDEITTAQIAGKATPALSAFPQAVASRLHLIPAFGDYTLSQLNADSFSIRKRTGENHSWINSSSGKRSAGTAYLGSPGGGVAFGIRNFWQSYPAQLDIRNAQTEKAEVTMWLWSPEAQAMDLRFYHDGMGMDNYEKQNEGLEITYEDYEPGYGSPDGVARTSEIKIWILAETPSNSRLAQLASDVQNPAVLLCEQTYLQKQKVFGGNWAVRNSGNATAARIEQRLDWYFDFYQKQVEQHNWYGFWNFGDVMHSYDADRHTWKYDIGGFAWDNSELSTDLWLWYYFLHTGKPQAFRMAEAMTRHTGEVDVHHIGKFAPLGSRHNVMHWGCSAKQMRISTAANRRFLYYLTADERIGDLLKEQVEAVKTLRMIKPLRKRTKPDEESLKARPANVVHCSFGTDWGSIAAAWLTEWERTGNNTIKNKLIRSMQTIAAQPKGFFSGTGYLNFDTGEFEISKKPTIDVSHLSAVFGLTEICEELILHMRVPEFEKAWLQYCRLYNAGQEAQKKELGYGMEKLNLRQGHSRLTAYAAHKLQDEQLAERAWNEFFENKKSFVSEESRTVELTGPDVLNPVTENKFISTNGTAQWGLAAIQCLAYIGEKIPSDIK